MPCNIEPITPHRKLCRCKHRALINVLSRNVNHRAGLIEPLSDHVPDGLLPHTNRAAGQCRVKIQREVLRAEKRGDQHITRVHGDICVVRTQQLDYRTIKLISQLGPRPTVM